MSSGLLLRSASSETLRELPKRFFISQPALTRQLQELEEEVGTKLLNRSTRNLTLTESGYLFLHRAEEILALANQAKRELSEKEISLRGIVPDWSRRKFGHGFSY